MLISPSGILRFIQCPEKFWLSISCKPLPLKTDVMVFGCNLHEIIAEYYRMLIKSDSITLSELEAKLVVAARKHGVGEQLYKKYRWHFKNFIKFEYERVGWNVDIKPIAVEKEFEKPPFRGTVDAIFKKGDGYVIVDWKSGSLYEDLPDFYKIQGCVYRYITGIDDVVFYFLGNGRYRRLVLNDCEDVSDIVSRVLNDIKNNVRYLNEGEHCRYCEYQIACLYNRMGWLDDWTDWTRSATEKAKRFLG